MKILIIEDDNKIVDALTFAFHTGWPEVELITADWGQEGVSMVETEQPDVVILDLGLPDISGLDGLKQIRSFSDVPVLVLSANDEEIIIVQAFGLGASDYVCKPFRSMELIARVRRLITQSACTGPASIIAWGPFLLDPAKRELKYRDKLIALRSIECIILTELVNKFPAVVTYGALANAVWGDDYLSATKCLKVHIYNLREKIEADPGNPQIILNKSGTGYYIVMQVQAPPAPFHNN